MVESKKGTEGEKESSTRVEKKTVLQSNKFHFNALTRRESMHTGMLQE